MSGETAVPNVAAERSQGTAELGNRAPELAEGAPGCMPSRGSLLEALMQLRQVQNIDLHPPNNGIGILTAFALTIATIY